ncbi:Uncharacterised protein [uncultured archaeon]|nr:Uncharacterised protein [uncultured archaeon]
MDEKGQGAFEYLLLIGGAILFVILVIAIVQSSLGTQQNNALNGSNKIGDVTNQTYNSVAATN